MHQVGVGALRFRQRFPVLHAGKVEQVLEAHVVIQRVERLDEFLVFGLRHRPSYASSFLAFSMPAARASISARVL